MATAFDRVGTMILGDLARLRGVGGRVQTKGLPDAVIERFAETQPSLRQAVARALKEATRIAREFPDLYQADEAEQVAWLQSGFVNFYAHDVVNPYVALAACGPWIVTAKGAIVHDSGGYGMLGLGHAPPSVLATLGEPLVMANVMTASFSQGRFVAALRREIGHTRDPGCPFGRFVCMNSGSEAVTVAARISDINAREMTDPGGRHAGKPIRILAVEGGFHGRTERPAQYSHSTLPTYSRYLASFRDTSRLWTVPPNDVTALRDVFARADRDGVFIESFFLEPVMGEGNPGLALTRGFYDAARELTRAHGSLLLIDSIQAGLRAHGVLSLVDYPGFEDAAPPDMETYSKALNAGQFPLSVLALTEAAANIYRKGVYGNTMTANPKALEVAVRVLEAFTPELRANIRARGAEFHARLTELANELDGAITGVQGTGLLLAAELAPEIKASGTNSVEEDLRLHGIGVIHGGRNALRFTPHFLITSEEIDLVLSQVRAALQRALAA